MRSGEARPGEGHRGTSYQGSLWQALVAAMVLPSEYSPFTNINDSVIEGRWETENSLLLLFFMRP